MSQRRKQSHRRRGSRARGEARLELWRFAFQDLVDQGRVIWVPDPDVRTSGDRLVVRVPHVGDLAIAAPVDVVVTAPARYGFILHEGASEWTLVIGTGANPGVVNEAVSVVEAHRRAGLPHELGGPLLQAIYDGEIPSELDPAGGPLPWVRVADVESWAAARAS